MTQLKGLNSKYIIKMTEGEKYEITGEQYYAIAHATPTPKIFTVNTSRGEVLINFSYVRAIEPALSQREIDIAYARSAHITLADIEKERRALEAQNVEEEASAKALGIDLAEYRNKLARGAI